MSGLVKSVTSMSKNCTLISRISHPRARCAEEPGRRPMPASSAKSAGGISP